MIWAKFRTTRLGDFWLKVDLQDNQQAEQWAKGLTEGYKLSNSDQFDLIDVRLSKHPTETTRELNWVREQFQVTQDH